MFISLFTVVMTGPTSETNKRFRYERHRRYEPVHEKTNNLGSDQVGHKLGCTVTEAG